MAAGIRIQHCIGAQITNVGVYGSDEGIVLHDAPFASIQGVVGDFKTDGVSASHSPGLKLDNILLRHNSLRNVDVGRKALNRAVKVVQDSSIDAADKSEILLLLNGMFDATSTQEFEARRSALSEKASDYAGLWSGLKDAWDFVAGITS